MVTLFGRPCNPMHEEFYKKALADLARGCAEDRAMAENLASDHRVGEVRAGLFHEYVRVAARDFEGIPDVDQREARALRQGLKDYFRAGPHTGDPRLPGPGAQRGQSDQS